MRNTPDWTAISIVAMCAIIAIAMILAPVIAEVMK
jgi:hypothetical protein